MIGIDLGTTYSAMAITDGTALPVIIRNREGENITPSVVMIQGGTAVVGSQAKRSAVTAPDYVVQFVKREMGEQTAVFTDENGKEYRAEEISAMILRRLKEDAEMQLGGTVDSAVITVPAYFDDARRVATRDAGRIAGLDVLRVINEPTAAVLAYGAEHPQGGDLGTVLVYDLGGGTFDVTIMKVGDGAYKVLATDGDRNLGGFDWDNLLMTELNDQFVARGGPDLTEDDVLMADLRDKAELAKRSLTLMPQTVVMLSAGGRTEQVKVTRAAFEELTRSLLRTTEQIAEKVLDETKLGWSDIDEVLLVGGSTRMPMVQDLVERLWGKAPRGGVNQDEAVALGAALMAYDEQARAAVREPGEPEETDTTGSALASLTRGKVMHISDVTSQTLGILVEDPPGSGRAVNMTMISHNSSLPARCTNNFRTAVANQTLVKVEVTEGDDPNPEYVRIIGTGSLAVPPYPENAPLEITYSYDLDAIIHVEVVDLTSGKSLGEFDIERSANLDGRQLDAMSTGLRGTGIA